MEKLLQNIKRARAEEVDAILDATLRRKQELYPDWDILYISLPQKDKTERRRTIETVLEYMKKARDAL